MARGGRSRRPKVAARGGRDLRKQLLVSRENLESVTVVQPVRRRATFCVLQAVAFALRHQDVAAMRHPVQRGSSEPFAAEDFRPVLEWHVGRHVQAIPLIRPRDHVEQLFGPGLSGGNVAKL